MRLVEPFFPESKPEFLNSTISASSGKRIGRRIGMISLRIIGLLFILTCGAVAKVGTGQLINLWNLHNALAASASSIQKTLPLDLSQYITLKRVDVRWLTYTYEYVTSEITTADVIGNNLPTKVCSSDLGKYIKQGATFEYNYLNQIGDVIANIKITNCP